MHGFLHVFLGGRQEQVDFESIQVLGHGFTAGEGRAGDVETVGVDRIGYAQAGVRGVARNDYNLGAAHLGVNLIDIQHGFDQGETGPRLEDVVLVFELVLAVGFEALRFEDLVFPVQIEQGT